MRTNRLAESAKQEGDAVKRYTFDCGWYLPPAAGRLAATTASVVVLIMIIAIAAGYGGYALSVAVTATLTVTVTEGCKALLRLRPRTT